MTETHRTPGPDTPAEIADVVRHTDSGAGASQADHWPENRAGPDGAAPKAPATPSKDAGSV